MAEGAPAAFFSYCRVDSKFALRLAEDLKAAGANVWLDQLDIEPGMPWDRAVETAVTNCPRMLVLLSPASVNSDNVRDEISFALSRQKRIIPVLYLECDVPFRLARLQHIDFSADYARGFKALLRSLGVEQQAVAASGAAVSVVPKESQPDVSDVDEHKRAAERARLEEEHKQAAEQAQLEEQGKLAADQARLAEERLEEERQQAAEQARVEQQGRRAAEQLRKAREEAEEAREKAQWRAEGHKEREQPEAGERNNQERISTEGTTAGILGNVEKQQPTPLVFSEKLIPSTWTQQKRRLIILFLTAIGVFFIVWAISSWQNRTNTQPNGRQEIAATPEARCPSGDAKRCFDLGLDYDNGTGVSKDHVRAAQLFKQACDGGAARGCNNLGLDYDNGTGVSKDHVRAAQLFKQGCDGGDARGCANLGFDYDNGRGVSKDQVRAAQLYKQACDGGDAQGCNNLKLMHASKKSY